MVPYQMNLAKGRILPLATRKQWRRWFVVYLILIVAIIGWFAGMLTRKSVVLSHQEERINLAEKRLLGERPGVVSVTAQMRKLSQEMTDCESQLKSIDGFLKKECHAACLLMGLVKVMPVGMELGQVGIDREAGTINIEVYVAPDRQGADGMTPPRLIALWKGEPLLAGKANHFTSEKSERVIIDGQEVMSWRFSGELPGVKQ